MTKKEGGGSTGSLWELPGCVGFARFHLGQGAIDVLRTLPDEETRLSEAVARIRRTQAGSRDRREVVMSRHHLHIARRIRPGEDEWIVAVCRRDGALLGAQMARFEILTAGLEDRGELR